MKVCFVALGAYPILANSWSVERIGGAELQQVEIGRGLSRRGLDISYIVTDHGQQEPEHINGLTIYKSFREAEGLFGLRFFYPRLYKIWRALRRADADIYYCRAAGFLPGVLSLFCRIYRKKFIFAGAHDTDFIPDSHLIPTIRDKWLYHYGLRRTSAIVVQTYYQQKLLWNNFRLKGTIIRNFLDQNTREIPEPDRQLILWVSTIREWKQPSKFIELARAFPAERFVMIGGPGNLDTPLFDIIQRQSSEVPNHQFIGFKPLLETEEYFDRCKVFINTSLHEGFPNTFLQAWRRGVPVISFVDPDRVITENELGLVATNESELREALRSILQRVQLDPDKIRSYFRENHSIGVIDHYLKLLESLTDATHKYPISN